jgi:hypothetical protein
MTEWAKSCHECHCLNLNSPIMCIRWTQNRGIVILETVRFVVKVTSQNRSKMIIKDVTVFYCIYITIDFTQIPTPCHVITNVSPDHNWHLPLMHIIGEFRLRQWHSWHVLAHSVIRLEYYWKFVVLYQEISSKYSL